VIYFTRNAAQLSGLINIVANNVIGICMIKSQFNTLSDIPTTVDISDISRIN